MTREEIVDELELYTVGRLKKSQVYITVEELQKYIDEIKALEQEPCEDAVNRHLVHRQINKWVASGESDKSLLSLHDRIDTLPPVTPVLGI